MLHRVCESDQANTEDAVRTYLEGLNYDRIQFIINQRNEKRYTPLHCAIFARSLLSVKVLVEYGADLTLRCNGTPPLQLALSCTQLPGEVKSQDAKAIFDLLLNNTPNKSLRVIRFNFTHHIVFFIFFCFVDRMI